MLDNIADGCNVGCKGESVGDFVGLSVGDRDGDDADCLQGILKLTKPDSNSNYDNGGCTSNEKDFTNNPDKFPGGYQKCINKTAQQPRCSGPIFGVKCPANQSWNFNKQTCE